MKLTETVVKFNDELLGQFVLVKGCDDDGNDVEYRGVVVKVTNLELEIHTVTAGEFNGKEFISSYNKTLYFHQFFERDIPELEFYQLYVYEKPTKVEVDENAKEDQPTADA